MQLAADCVALNSDEGMMQLSEDDKDLAVHRPEDMPEQSVISKNDDIIYAHIMPILEAKWCTSPDSDFYSHIFNLFSCLIIYNVQFLYMSHKAVI